MKSFRRVISALLVASIMISTVGYTVVTFACPKMATQSQAKCSMCAKAEKPSAKTKNCCKPIVEHKVIRTDSTRPHEAHSVQLQHAVLPQPMLAVGSVTDLFALDLLHFVGGIPPLPPDASTARAMLSTFLI